ncbi:MAG: hypothetical protein ACP5VS_18130, partial [Desulfomonilaceae bacterium]
MTLERRFFIFLLVPIAAILAAFGSWGFFFARSYLLDQWLISIHLQLEKAAHEISMSLNEKLELINLIAKAENTPSRNITQAFLIQALTEKPGVRFVDIIEATQSDETRGTKSQLNGSNKDLSSGSYT